MNNDVAIRVDGVSKSFKLPHEKSNSVKSALLGWRNRKRGYEMQHVLKDVSFEIKKGEFFGIVGRNGSGKSTLLKLISQIYTPDKGRITVNGKLTPFIELGVGFNPELSGRDNVYLNGALLGFNREEMDAMYDQIVEFAELERFMDQKLKNYSSGMQVRLAFSIAIRANTDILVLDEVLAVGDEAFQRKCNEYFSSVKKQGKTIILVTHSMDAVRKYCTRAILVREGRVIIDGSSDEVADEYSLDNIQSNQIEAKKDSGNKSAKPTISARITSRPILENTDKLQVEVKYRNNDERAVYSKVIIYYEDVPVMAANAKVLYDIVTNDTEEHTLKYELPLNNFNQGEANVIVVLVDSDEEVSLSHYGYDNELPFVIKNAKTGKKIGGIMRDLGQLELIK